jgi:hypothetical protein
MFSFSVFLRQKKGKTLEKSGLASRDLGVDSLPEEAIGESFINIRHNRGDCQKSNFEIYESGDYSTVFGKNE